MKILLPKKRFKICFKVSFFERWMTTTISKIGIEITNNGLNLKASKNLKCNNSCNALWTPQPAHSKPVVNLKGHLRK